MPRKSPITVTNRAEGAKNSGVELARRNPALARRLAGNPYGTGSRKIPLKEGHYFDGGRWHTHESNDEIHDGRAYDMREKGWTPVTVDDLACKVEESGYRLSPDGYLVRGAQGRQMLWKMDKEDYRLLEQKKTEVNMRGVGSTKKIKQDMAEAASGPLGSEAADYISNLDGQVVDRITGGDAA